jgi:hypothetical protein
MTKTRELGLCGRDGVLNFMRAYLVAPNDADVVVRLCGADELPGETMLAITLSHSRPSSSLTLGLRLGEARAMADICEATMRTAPHGADPSMGLPNLILALRQGADQLAKEVAP